MEERIYTFYSKAYGVHYDNLTKEELELLNQSYRKEQYMSKEQNIRMNTWNFSDLESEEFHVEEMLEDPALNVENQVVVSDLIEELFSTLTPGEQLIVLKHLIEGYQMTELVDELGVSYRQVKRNKKTALEKMKKYLEKKGITSYNNALARYL